MTQDTSVNVLVNVDTCDMDRPSHSHCWLMGWHICQLCRARGVMELLTHDATVVMIAGGAHVGRTHVENKLPSNDMRSRAHIVPTVLALLSLLERIQST